MFPSTQIFFILNSVKKESFFGEFQFGDTFQIQKFLRQKKLRDSWDCWQEKNVLVATAPAGEGAREQLRIVAWSRHTITDYTCRNYPDNWHLSQYRASQEVVYK